MRQNVYVAFDKVSGRSFRIIFSDNDSTMVRDNVNIDIRSDKNPIGLPFKDLGYKHIANYNTETLFFENVENREIDILKSYDFKIEKPMTKNENLNESNVNDFSQMDKDDNE